MSLWLTEKEIIELTGYKRRELQRTALAELRVRFRIRPADGFPLVDRSQFQQPQTPAPRREPNWSAA